VRIDCASIPEHLLESELFGYKKGAFTGADQDRKGLITAADGGVVLLDEIGELPLEMQAKLLRLLQEKQVRPVGGIKPKTVDIRFIAATNRDLKKAVDEGLFRSDLYHRLAIFPIHIPPLRERREDIPLLVSHFLAQFSRKFGRLGLSISSQALRYLYGLQYDGNVRELAALVERAILMSSPESMVISLEHFTGEVDVSASSLPEKVAQYERQLIEEALVITSGNQAEAAEALGIPRRTLNNKVKKTPKAGGGGNSWN
jgi:sigma-54-dependent transcriptional regulator